MIKTLCGGGTVPPGVEQTFRETECMKQLMNHSLENIKHIIHKSGCCGIKSERDHRSRTIIYM